MLVAYIYIALLGYMITTLYQSLAHTVLTSIPATHLHYHQHHHLHGAVGLVTTTPPPPPTNTIPSDGTPAMQ